MAGARVVVCDDELLIRTWLQRQLTEAGLDARAVATGKDLLDEVRSHPPDIVLLDLRLPDGSGLDFLQELKELDPELPVIMISAHGEIETAVEAVRRGAAQFLEKPVDSGRLVLLIEQALEARRLRGAVARYQEGNRWQFSDVTLVGRSRAMHDVAGVITRLGERGTPATVLIRGESGTGKDVVARAIHARGPRGAHPFIRVNCTALPENLVESELFGHEPGSFTGAQRQKRGLLELADGGTAFLDEIGDMPLAGQAKLLQFLETRQLRRVGGIRDIPVDVQVIAATNRNLEEAVEEGGFREDLFYRMNVVPIMLLPLRERPDDIVPQALRFLQTLSQEMRIEPPGLSQEAATVLEGYSWPGNARELRNVLERLLLFTDVGEVRPEHLPADVHAREGPGGSRFPLPAEGVDLEVVEREFIEQAMDRAAGKKTIAAQLLGITRDKLRYRLEKFQLEGRGAGAGDTSRPDSD